MRCSKQKAQNSSCTNHAVCVGKHWGLEIFSALASFSMSAISLLPGSPRQLYIFTSSTRFARTCVLALSHHHLYLDNDPKPAAINTYHIRIPTPPFRSSSSSSIINPINVVASTFSSSKPYPNKVTLEYYGYYIIILSSAAVGCF